MDEELKQHVIREEIIDLACAIEKLRKTIGPSPPGMGAEAMPEITKTFEEYGDNTQLALLGALIEIVRQLKKDISGLIHYSRRVNNALGVVEYPEEES